MESSDSESSVPSGPLSIAHGKYWLAHSPKKIIRVPGKGKVKSDVALVLKTPRHSLLPQDPLRLRYDFFSHCDSSLGTFFTSTAPETSKPERALFDYIASPGLVIYCTNWHTTYRSAPTASCDN